MLSVFFKESFSGWRRILRVFLFACDCTAYHFNQTDKPQALFKCLLLGYLNPKMLFIKHLELGNVFVGKVHSYSLFIASLPYMLKNQRNKKTL